MRTIVLISAVLLSFFGYGQNNPIEEKMYKELCNEFKQKTEKADTILIQKAYEKVVFPYLDKWNEEKWDSVSFSISVRLQKECPEYRQLLERIYPVETEEVKFFDKPQKSVISDTELQEFKDEKYFYYLANYVPTYLIIDNGMWFEFFEDKTYSKNLMQWDDRNKFTLTFVESNNLMKKAYSREGDQYHYEIISKENDWYWIQMPEPGGNRFVNIKIYILVKNGADE
ncbi:MAG: hypothetical protein WBF83_12105 [Moheibacter sp.]